MKFTHTAFVVVGLVLALIILRPAHTETASPTLTQLAADLAALQTRVTTLEGQVTALQSALSAETSARQAAETTLQNNIGLEAAARAAGDVGLQGQIDNNNVPQNLLDLANYVSVDLNTLDNLTGPHVVFGGANVHIRSGSGTTNSQNGLGNFIIGYNEATSPTQLRNGSHNLVVGPFHEYSSYGGLVAGFQNVISNRHASVSGGNGNIARGAYASVSGGAGNVAHGENASVSGGFNNTAFGISASVSGGVGNGAGDYASVSGGGGFTVASGNFAIGVGASVSGGSDNRATGDFSTVSGGFNETASLIYDHKP